MSTPATTRQTKISTIVDALVGDIVNGHLKPGDQIEPERALSRRFGVSLGTVQRALEKLHSRRIVTREHGRGTFVSEKATTVDARFVRFRDSSGADLPLYISILGTARASHQGPWARFFGEPYEFRRITRIINVGGRFDLFSDFVMRANSFRSLTQHGVKGLEANLRQAIADRLALPTTEVRQFVRFEPLPDRVARILEHASDCPGFIMEMQGFAAERKPLFFQRIFGGDLKGAALVIER